MKKKIGGKKKVKCLLNEDNIGVLADLREIIRRIKFDAGKFIIQKINQIYNFYHYKEFLLSNICIHST